MQNLVIVTPSAAASVCIYVNASGSLWWRIAALPLLLIAPAWRRVTWLWRRIALLWRIPWWRWWIPWRRIPWRRRLRALWCNGLCAAYRRTAIYTELISLGNQRSAFLTIHFASPF